MDRDIGELAADVERAVRLLARGPGAHGLEGLARFLLRSEAIASSRIEGMEVSPQQVGLAELADDLAPLLRPKPDAATAEANEFRAVRTAFNKAEMLRG